MVKLDGSSTNDKLVMLGNEACIKGSYKDAIDYFTSFIEKSNKK